ncbi:hypothetical protein BKA56DRAFT_345861 [Ilyonectria sp. MPI-CAGE-AT-0026]|nr:hypothetical protein BKA56DRAFT_345861 [Ilyonectria sp. MPI-CAGE-AT-0026]
MHLACRLLVKRPHCRGSRRTACWATSSNGGPLGKLGSPSTREPGATSGCRIVRTRVRERGTISSQKMGVGFAGRALPGWDAAGEDSLRCSPGVYEIVQAPRSADPSADGRLGIAQVPLKISLQARGEGKAGGHVSAGEISKPFRPDVPDSLQDDSRHRMPSISWPVLCLIQCHLETRLAAAVRCHPPPVRWMRRCGCDAASQQATLH